MFTSNGELEFSDYEKAEINVCLNCTRPAEDCDGECEFDDLEAQCKYNTVKIKDLDTGVIYNSITEAATALNRSKSAVRKASKSETRRVAGHRLVRVK